MEKMEAGNDRNQPAYLDVVQRTNIKLKKIASIIGITSDLSSGCARHSWATIAVSIGIPKTIIAKGMAHAANTITDVYIDFEWKLLDVANREIIDTIKSTPTTLQPDSRDA